MRALVLGGTGPTGPYIVDGLLQRSYEVTVMHSGLHEVEFSQPVEHIHGDVHFEETLKESLANRTFDLVVAGYGRLKLTADVMVGRTGRFISIGGAVLARPNDPRWGPAGPPLGAPEESPVRIDPEGDRFSYLMYMAEQHVLEHHRAGHYNVSHFRYPMIYGPRQLATDDWCIVRRALDSRRQLIVPDGGLKLLSRAYASNAAHALLLAVDQPEASAGQAYNVADERVLSLKQRINLIARALNHEWELVSMPYDLARAAHPYCRGRDHIVVDIAKIKTQLGYRDVVPAAEAVTLAARWLVENRPEPGGELETQLADPFDYAAEDAMIRAYLQGMEQVLAVPFKKYLPVHPYRHPKQPNEAWQRPQYAWGRRPR